MRSFDPAFDSKRQKKPPKTGGQMGSSMSFSANKPIIPIARRAVKSTLTMLVIATALLRNGAGAIRLGHLPHAIGAVFLQLLSN